ncbi:hypothetical protein SETIT_5G011000v2 [Setaria italica]|uniref:Uncharacterized protein n=2 Tax=Setaria TaxID=4554 RepID=A0A368QZX1_SETIT
MCLCCCSIIGVHPAEKIVAQVSSSILLIFTIVLGVAVPLKVSKLDEHWA